MEKQYSVKIWGTRGSFPHPAADYLVYGGNTSCVSLELNDAWLIFDAGTGFAEFGKHYMMTCDKRPIHLFLSHSHMDHLMGFYNFAPFFKSDCHVTVYGEAKFGMTLEEQVANIMQKPYWPINTDMMPANVNYRDISPDMRISLGGQADITTIKGSHPGGALCYKLTVGEKSFIYALDCELNTEAYEKTLEAFAEKADMIICDAHFDVDDIEKHSGWGHSSWLEQSDLRRAAEIKQAVFMHYAWEYDDRKIAELEQRAAEADRQCIFAKEGMELWL